MVKNFFGKIRLLWSRPSDFYGQISLGTDEKESTRFAVMMGLLLAVELALAEVWSGGSLRIVALVTALLLVGLPVAVVVGARLWARFMKLCAYLLGENLSLDPLVPIVAYSTAGLAVSALGWGLGKWLTLIIFLFQFMGVIKVMGCSRWVAAVYVGLPFSLAAVLFGFFTLIFKIYK